MCSSITRALFILNLHPVHSHSKLSGVMICPIEWTTTQGYDMQLGTNVLGNPLIPCHQEPKLT